MASDSRPPTLYRHVFLLALAVRLPLALLQRTPFQPDETFQSLEPAYALVFGPGAAYLSWEWRWNPPAPEALGARWGWLAEGRLRSSAWVAVWAAVFWVLQQLALDEALIIVAPKAVMVVVAAACDTATFALARRLSPSSGPTALMLSLTSVFHAHALTRALANSAETTLTTIALCLWPSLAPAQLAPRAERRAWRRALAVVALTCVLRPTNAVVWVGPGVGLLWSLLRRRQGKRGLGLVLDVVWIAALVLGLSTALDTALFPPPPTATLPFALPPLTFLAHNVLLPTSLFYGTNASHFYLSQGLPILLGLSLPWAALAFGRACAGTLGPRARALAAGVAGTVAVFSLAGHKEWRFIHPCLPVLHVLTALALSRPATATPTSTPAASSASDPAPEPSPALFPRRLALVLALSAVPQVAYLSLAHGAAQHAVLSHLHASVPPADAGGSLGALMPCHSTPWQSHLHRPDLPFGTHAWFLECPPPPPGTPAEKHLTEEAEFYADPARFLRLRFPPTPYPSAKSLASLRRFVPALRPWPSHLLVFGALVADAPGVRALLVERGYKEDERWARERPWNGWDWAQDDGRRKGGVEVWVLRPRAESEGE